MDDRLLTIPKTAEILGVHRITIYREIERGRLRRVKIGKAARIRASEVERFVAASTETPAGEQQ